MGEISYYDNLVELMDEHYPFFSALWKLSKKNFGKNWEKDFNTNVEVLLSAKKINTTEKKIVDGYSNFCSDALMSQAYFEKHLKYELSSYNEVVEKCYSNEDYMNNRYLPGQFIAHFIWPHHYKLMENFQNEILYQIKDDIKLFYEVGVGCGMYSLKTLQNINDVVGIGYDISDYSLNFTKNIIDENKFQSRYSVENYDLTKRPVEKKADLIISQEVLEHLENPQEFIISLYKSVRNNGWGYITAAINAGHTDHIYLYKSPEEVEKQLLSAGWKILKRNIEYANDYTPLHIRPTIAAYLLQK
tara:strand:- start:219 stop:1124 length:906 start_codon:yes stop_codon:yes gene_type:complete